MKNDQHPGLNFPAQVNFVHLPGNLTPITAAVRSGVEGAKPEPLAYDIKQAAAKLNVCTKTIRRLLHRNKLTCCKVVRKVLIPREQVENFLKRTCDKPTLD